LKTLHSAYEYCKEVVKRSAGNFYFAFQLLPRTKRYAIYAVYAFCRAADDAVDELPEPSLRRQALEKVQHTLERVYKGDSETPLEIALADTVGKYRLTKQYFDDLLLGMEADIPPQVELGTLEELDEYCYRAAGTVGLLCIEVFGAAGDAAKKYAMALGRALQLTNVIRDLREDALNGRVYVPKALLDAHGVTVDDLRNGRNDHKVERLIHTLIGLAKAAYLEAERYFPTAHRWRLITSEAMRRVYHALLLEIERDPRKVMEKRVSLPVWRKAGEVIAAFATV
jgi:phytoene synthase